MARSDSADIGPRLAELPKPFVPEKPARRLIHPRSRLLRAGDRSRDPIFSGSDFLTTVLAGDAAGIADELMWNTVTDGMVRSAAREILDASRESLERRGFPEEFTVYRGGKPAGDLVPVSLCPSTARTHSRFNGRDGLVVAYRIRREHVLVDVDVFQSCFCESELIVPREHLRPLGHWRPANP